MIQTARLGSYQGGKGYMSVDDRVSGGTFQEWNTLTCAHCSTVVILNPNRTRPRARCIRCSRYICDKPACSLDCNYGPEMVDLALAFPAGGPFLARTASGQVRYDTVLRDSRRLH